MVELEQLINDKAFCAWVGISRNTARAWRNEGKLPFIRLPRGAGIRYRERDVRTFLRNGERAARG